MGSRLADCDALLASPESPWCRPTWTTLPTSEKGGESRIRRSTYLSRSSRAPMRSAYLEFEGSAELLYTNIDVSFGLTQSAVGALGPSDFSNVR